MITLLKSRAIIPPQFYQAASVDFSQSRQDLTLDNKSFALYGQATYALTDQLNVTLGIRRSEDEKDVITQMITNTPGYPFVAAPFSLPQTLEYSSTDPKLSIDYAINDNSMAYITYASGYKSGGAHLRVGPRLGMLMALKKSSWTLWKLAIKRV